LGSDESDPVWFEWRWYHFLPSLPLLLALVVVAFVARQIYVSYRAQSA